MVVLTALRVIRVHLFGDGTTRLKAGASVETPSEDSAQGWSQSDFRSYYPVPPLLWDGAAPEGDVQRRPDRPPNLAPEKRWFFVAGRRPAGFNLELRDIKDVGRSDVFVFREGLSMPTHTLLRVVNQAHAVLVLRGSREYFYLQNDFALSTDDEESLVEWAVGRPMFANSWLAVTGLVFVRFVEQVWRPSVLGILLVAAAVYRVQGVLTAVLRVRSDEWKGNQLVPSGVSRIERVVQLVLAILLALANLLDDRKWLLAALTYALVQVVLTEAAGQVLTWGFSAYMVALFGHVFSWMCLFSGFAVFCWLLYVAPLFFLVSMVGTVVSSMLHVIFHGRKRMERGVFFLFLVVGISMQQVFLGMGDLYSFSPQAFQPWTWDFDSSTLQLSVGVALAVASPVVLISTIRLLSFTIGFDSIEPRGTKTKKRGEGLMFVEYHKSSIPSRNKFPPPPPADVQ